MNPASSQPHAAHPPVRNRTDNLPKTEDIFVALSEISHHELQSDILKNYKKGGIFIPSFSAGTVANIQETILRYFVEEFGSISAAILEILPGNEEFRVFSLPLSNGVPIARNTKFSSRHFPGVLQTIRANPQIPTIFNENLENWKQLFPSIVPTVLILIPWTLVCKGHQRSGSLTRKSKKSTNSLGFSSNRKSGGSPVRARSQIQMSTIACQTISTITVLAFTTKTLPLKFLEESTWELLIATCQLNAPLLVNGVRYEAKMNQAKRLENIMDGVRNVQKLIQDLGGCANDIGLELQNIFGSQHAVIYILNQDGDDELKLNKYKILGPVKLDPDCPDKGSHTRTEFVHCLSFPAGISAVEQKCLRINDLPQLHSYGSCLVRNMMCVFIKDQTNDMSLVVELSNKSGGYSEGDEEDAKLFANLVGNVLSSSVMLEYRRNAIRRNEITNKIVNNITKVHFKKVKKLLDFRFRQTIYFSKRFYTIKFTFNELPKEQYTGVILFMFSELGFLKRWKMRKATVIRFILSLAQGYFENSYHNWKHACTVTHFAFYLLKEMELQHHGFCTDLEALALIIACLAHDVGHRGLNNHFGMFADKDAKHLQSQEISLAERHHVALALQILSTEDCNIVENLTDHEYAEFMELVQFSIIATDLSKHLIDRTEQFKIMQKFNKRKREHRRAFMSLIMTASDMCETIKPWADYIITVKNIFFEFFEQGDEELRLGYTPTPIMDRRIAYIPYIELKFIDDIVRPVYEAISELLPKAEEALFKTDYFKELWLIATKVFDDNVLNPNPLEVLTLPEMDEECLKGEVNVELEKTVYNIRQTTDSIRFQPLVKRNTFVHLSARSKDGMGCGHRMKEFSRSLQACCCCRRCRHRALYNAEYVRKMRHELSFMEERSDEYEARRIQVLYPGQFPEEIHPREMIENLINPNAEKVGVAAAEAKK